MSLTTPDKIRTLQRKLYVKAKAEPAFRFYVLYDKICRDDILFTPTGLPAPMRERRVWMGSLSRRSRKKAWRYGWRACVRNWFRRRTGQIRCGG